MPTRPHATVDDGVDDGVDDAKAPPASGSVRSALRNRQFRTLWAGSFASNIGTWMQNVAVGPYALALSKSAANPRGSATFVALVGLAQLGPQLLLAVVGGVLANRLPRRILIMTAQSCQMIATLVLAFLAIHHPTKLGLVLCVLGSGVANALSQPSFQAMLPELVDRADMPGVISLNSTALNGSRVIGPILLLLLRPIGVRADTPHGIATIFVINALTFLFVIAAVASVPIRRSIARTSDDTRGLKQLLAGFSEAKRNPVVGRCLLVMVGMSLVSLPFISQMPTIAERNLGIASRAGVYSALFGTFGFGAMLGSLAQGTVLAGVDKRRSTRWLLLGFALALAAFALVRSPAPAFVAIFVLGFFYFGSTTSILTVVQQHIGDRERAPIMSLWMMSFGGTVPLGGYWGGWAMDHWSVSGVLLIGVAMALALSVGADLAPRSERMRADGSLAARVGTSRGATAAATAVVQAYSSSGGQEHTTLRSP